MTTSTLLFERALIRLSGDDVRGFLQNIVTNDVTGSLPVWAALLTAQGKLLFDFLVWSGSKSSKSSKSSDDVLIDCESAAVDALEKRLKLYRLRRAIAIEREEGLRVHWALDVDHASKSAPVNKAVLDPRLAALGYRWLARASDGGLSDTETNGNRAETTGAETAKAETAKAETAGADKAWRSHRLSLGVAEGRSELGDGQLLWLECNATELNGVDFSKGCYVGQENTARMNWRKKINRRVVVVPLARADSARQRIAYPDLGWSVEHRRTGAIDLEATPQWLRAAVE